MTDLQTIIGRIEKVAFELSNLCPHAHLHPSCPASLRREPVYLNTDAILVTLDQLGSWGYKNSIIFSIYNEPFTDPRFFMLLEAVRNLAPQAKVMAWTSSFWLNDQIIVEAHKRGLHTIHVNGYTPDERKRAASLRIPPGMYSQIRDGHHDDRMHLYERPPQFRGRRSCGAPYKDVTIYHDGSVGLCCFDWKRTVTFGNIGTQRLGDILLCSKMQEVHDRNERDGLWLDVCLRCGRSR